MKLKAIVTGATGMVGEGVLHECLLHEDVESVLVIGRRPCGVSHPKLKEIIHKDFLDITSIAKQLKGYNACFFCLGRSSVGMSAEDYYRVTYDLTLHVAGVLARNNPDMVFCYVSGLGTDSTEKGRVRWARVKGKVENDLMNLPFKKAYGIRPGFMKPTEGLKNAAGYYRALGFLYAPLRSLFPKYITTLAEVGIAMINVALRGYHKPVLEVEDLLAMSKINND
jgi:uncharacterized protein YbjT (DUF2867 family)